MVVNYGFSAQDSYDIFAGIQIVEIKCGPLIICLAMRKDNELFKLAFYHCRHRVEMIHFCILFHDETTIHD